MISYYKKGIYKQFVDVKSTRPIDMTEEEFAKTRSIVCTRFIYWLGSLQIVSSDIPCLRIRDLISKFRNHVEQEDKIVVEATNISSDEVIDILNGYGVDVQIEKGKRKYNSLAYIKYAI